MSQQSCYLIYIQNLNEHGKEMAALLCLFLALKISNQTICPPTQDWMKKTANTHDKTIYNLQRERNLDTCDDMDESGGHHVKINTQG